MAATDYRGEISVSSEVGKGSKFTVTLPVSERHFHKNEIIEPIGEEDSITDLAEPDLGLAELEATEIYGTGISEKPDGKPVFRPHP